MQTNSNSLVFAIITFFAFLSGSAIAQETDENSIAVFAALGIQETVATGVDFPITESVKAGLKGNRVVTWGGPRSEIITALGIGLTTSYRFAKDERFLNVANLEISYLYHIFAPYTLSHGINYECTVGHRSTLKGVHFFWAAGAGFTTGSNLPNFYYPCAQVGYQWNL